MENSPIELDQEKHNAIDFWTQKGLLALEKKGYYTNHLDEIIDADLLKRNKWAISDVLPYLNRVVDQINRIHKINQIKPSVVIDLGYYDTISNAISPSEMMHSTIPPALYLIDRSLDQLCEPGEIFISTFIKSSYVQGDVFFHSYRKVVRHIIDGDFEQEFSATICIDVFPKVSDINKS